MCPLGSHSSKYLGISGSTNVPFLVVVTLYPLPRYFVTRHIESLQHMRKYPCYHKRLTICYIAYLSLFTGTYRHHLKSKHSRAARPKPCWQKRGTVLRRWDLCTPLTWCPEIFPWDLRIRWNTDLWPTLQWRHNVCDGVWNHQPHDCLLNRLFRHRSKKTSNLGVTSLWEGNSPVTGEFPAQWASNAENVSIWWRHHAKPEQNGRRLQTTITQTPVSGSFCLPLGALQSMWATWCKI